MVRPRDADGVFMGFSAQPVASENVASFGSDVRVGLMFSNATHGLAVGYQRSGHPRFAVRVPASRDDRCFLNYVEWNEGGICVGAFGRATQPLVALYSESDSSAPSGAVNPLPPETIEKCGAHLASTVTGMGAYSVARLATGNSSVIVADASPRIRGSEALYFQGGRLLQLMPSGGSRQVLDASPKVLVDARQDDTYLVWLTTESGDLQAGTLWRSNLEDGRPIDPVSLGTVPAASATNGFHRIGGGYYAVIEGSASSIPDTPTRLHLFRLLDGRRWIVPDQPDQYTAETGAPPRAPGLRTTASGIVHLDETEIWWVGASQSYTYARSLFRQRLDSLGPGE